MHAITSFKTFLFQEVLTLNDEVTTRFDLLDCNMAICTPQIPPLFSDNFDFQSRRHLIREILTNEEVCDFFSFFMTGSILFLDLGIPRFCALGRWKVGGFRRRHEFVHFYQVSRLDFTPPPAFNPPFALQPKPFGALVLPNRP